MLVLGLEIAKEMRGDGVRLPVTTDRQPRPPRAARPIVAENSQFPAPPWIGGAMNGETGHETIYRYSL